MAFTHYRSLKCCWSVKPWLLQGVKNNNTHLISKIVCILVYDNLTCLWLFTRPQHTCMLYTKYPLVLLGPGVGPVDVKLDWPPQKSITQTTVDWSNPMRHSRGKDSWWGRPPPPKKKKNWENYKQFGEFRCISAYFGPVNRGISTGLFGQVLDNLS